MSAADRVSGLNLLWLVAGFTVWSSGFVLLYGVHAIGCRAGWPGVELGPLTVQRAVLLAIWAVHLAAGWALFVPLRGVAKRWTGPAGDFLKGASVLVTLAALVSTLWIGAPVLFLETCR